MNESVKAKTNLPFKDIIRNEVNALATVGEQTKTEFTGIIDKLPIAYSNVPAIFRSLEAKTPGAGGLFSIFVSDLCKGCGECVQVCGDHDALRMAPETEELNADLTTAQIFSRLLPDTPQKYLGLYNDTDAAGSREAALRNHLMVRRNYEALVSGDGACAGCGEKSVLRALASVTEAYMRPMYHRKADRLRGKATRLETEGVAKLQALKQRDEAEYHLYRKAVAHIIMGLGGEDDDDTAKRIADYEAKHGALTDEQIVNAVVAVMRQDAFNHRDLQSIDGRRANGMSVMFMGASTGCNTVYGSTPPSNPHPYPWMNSLFQDGATISWLLGESLILNHARRSVVPERLADDLLDHTEVMTPADFFLLTHLDDALMTDQEIRELPKVWVVGGDGALGDIGFQNVSKVILQNRPNVKMLMLDTQVYSNTGGQNSDSSTMLGGYDMNQFGVASQGKLIEKKNVAEAFTSGHGSPFVAQVSMANAAKLYKAMLDGLEYRGTAFFQAYTTCQPEHGVPRQHERRPGQARPRRARHAGVRVQSAQRRDGAGSVRPQGQSHADARLVADEIRQHGRGIQLHRGALGAHRGPVPQAHQGHQGRGSAGTDPARRHAGAHHAGRRDLPARLRQEPPHLRPELRLLHQGRDQRQDEVLRREPADGAVRRGTPQSLAHAAKQSRRGEQGLPGAESVARETGQRRTATRRRAGKNPRTIRR